METPEDDIDVSLVIRARMTRHVVRPGAIDTRTGFALKKAGTLITELPNQVPPDIVDVLKDPRHNRRISEDKDPLLVYEAQDGRRQAIELHAILLNSDQSVRSAVLDEIERKLNASASFCSNAARATFFHHAALARSEDPGIYLDACLRIHDGMRSDLRYSTELFNQACRDGVLDSVLDYLERILRPMQNGLGCLFELPLIHYLNGALDLADLFEEITEKVDIGEMLENYTVAFGYVPIAGQFSPSAALRTWRDLHPDAECSWSRLAEWADNATSVLPQYLIAQAIIGNQDILSDDDVPDVSTRIRAAIRPSREEGTLDPWTLRQTIARYYCRYLTCEYPDSDTERMSICAWWLAEEITGAILRGSPELRRLCLDRLSEVSEATEELWLLVQPSGQASSLFSISIQHRHLWGESLTAEIACKAVSEGLTLLSPETLFSIMSSALGGALLGQIGGNAEARLTYSFCLDVLPFVTQVRDALADTELALPFTKAIVLTEKLRSPEEFVTSITTLPEAEDDVACVVGFMLQQCAFANDGPRDHVWNCLTDAEWRRRLIHSQSGEGFRRFSEACIRYQVNASSDKWKFELPHLFAIAAIDECPSDTDRLATLVGYCVVSSIAGGCTSSIQRLACARNDGRIKPLLAEWYKRINNIIRFARPLAASRLRPVKQALGKLSV